MAEESKKNAAAAETKELVAAPWSDHFIVRKRGSTVTWGDFSEFETAAEAVDRAGSDSKILRRDEFVVYRAVAIVRDGAVVALSPKANER